MITVLAARRWPHILRRFPKLDPLPVCSEDSAFATERGFSFQQLWHRVYFQLFVL